MEKKYLPIGYWLKRVDIALTAGIDQIQLVHGINRTDWQVLHSIKQEAPISRSSIANTMQAFASEDELSNALNKMIAKGWLTSQDDIYSLTVSGEVFYEDCLAQQSRFRKKAMQGIRNDDYETTVTTLQQILANLNSQ